MHSHSPQDRTQVQESPPHSRCHHRHHLMMSCNHKLCHDDQGEERVDWLLHPRPKEWASLISMTVR